MKKNKKSIKRQITVYFALPVFILIFALLYGNIRMIQRYNREMAGVSRDIMDIYMENLKNTIQKADEYFIGTLAGNDDFEYLVRRRDKKEVDASIYGAIKALARSSQLNLNFNDIVSAYIIMDTYHGLYQTCVQNSQNIESADRVRQYLWDAPDAFLDNRQWTFTMIDDVAYLIRVMERKDVYMAGAIELNRIPKPANTSIGGDYMLVYTDAAMDVADRLVDLDALGIKLKPVDGTFYTSGKWNSYVIISEQVPGTDIWMNIIKSNRRFFSEMRSELIIFFGLWVLSVLLVPYGLWQLRRLIFNPIHILIQAVLQIKAGDFETEITADDEIVEFGEIQETLNHMVREIGALKLESYEQQLTAQKAQMQYLSLQLKPHFYLNCLKTIYGMAQNRDYKGIQQLTLIVSRHLRYIFRDNTQLVTLNDELSYVDNYLELQRTAHGRDIACTIHSEPEAGGIKVPPLILQTFVENSVKYGFVEQKPLTITMDICLLPARDVPLCDITITDNGPGYPLEILERLRNIEQSFADMHEHVGIFNLLSRLRLLYGSKAEWHFDSTPQGAFSELIFPIKGGGTGE